MRDGYSSMFRGPLSSLELELLKVQHCHPITLLKKAETEREREREREKEN